jgi:rhodanese-related sulfurtransferase
VPLRRAGWLALLLLAEVAGGCAGRERLANGAPLRRVNAAVAFNMLRDTPDLLIVDLRTPAEFHGEYGHLARAANLPLEEASEHIERYQEFRSVTFLVYCREGDVCGRRGMELLQANGFRNAVLMDGGVEGWLAAGFGTVGKSRGGGAPDEHSDAVETPTSRGEAGSRERWIEKPGTESDSVPPP